MPLGDEYRPVRYPDWQKQDHVAWLALAVPLHACAALFSRVHVRRAKRVVRSIVGNMAAG
jgi:hypothetical protein